MTDRRIPLVQGRITRLCGAIFGVTFRFKTQGTIGGF